MGILSYIITLRIKRIFDYKAHPIKTLSLFLLFIISIIYGYVFTQLYNSPELLEKGISQRDFEKYFIYFIILITLIRGFFPAYIPIENVINRNYPINKLKRYFCNITNEFIYPFYFALFFFIITSSFGVNKGFLFIMVVLNCVIISHFLKRTIQLFLQFKINGIKYYLILIPFFAFSIWYFFFFEITVYANIFITLIIAITFISINFMLDQCSKEPKTPIKINPRKREKNIYFFNLPLNNKSMRTMVFVSIIMKIFFIFMNWSIFHKNDGLSSAFELTINILLSPLILYSYFANNIFGFIPSLWLSMNKASANLRTFSKIILQILSIPLIIDSAFTITFLFFIDRLNYSNISFYIGSSILLFVIGLLNSFYFPKKVNGLFSMNGNTLILGNIFSMLAVVILVLLNKYIVYSNILFSTLIMVGLYLLTKNRISKTRYKLFQKLFT